MLRLGVGAGTAGDRFEPAVEMIERCTLDALIFECLAERTIAMAQSDLLHNLGPGYDARILTRLESTLARAAESGTVIITNAGAAAPLAAGKAIHELSERLGVPRRVGVVTGDDVLGLLHSFQPAALGETDRTVQDYQDRMISANAYLGSQGIVDLLAQDCDVIVTGRVADAALFLAPLIHHFDWSGEDWDRLAGGAVVGHLLECAGQLTGGYFDDAQGGLKSVPNLATIGFPYAEVTSDGSARLRRPAGSGGRLDRRTATEQLLYEVADPHAYVTPDVTIDMCDIRIEEQYIDESVVVTGARGAPRPEELKVSVGVRDGVMAIGEISYAGPGCIQRAQMAIDILRERWESVLGYGSNPLECSFVGVNSCWPWQKPEGPEPLEVRARFGIRSMQKQVAISLLNEVEGLYTNGPAGGGGVALMSKNTVGIVSTFLPRETVISETTVIES